MWIREGLCITFMLWAIVLGAEVLDTPPKNPDPDQYYLFYEHGRIVEGSDGRPISPRFGPYEYRAILDALARHGFVVISEIRPANADIEVSAQRLASRVRQLLDGHVSASHITIVGASKGGAIVARASNILRQRELRVAILAGFFKGQSSKEEFLPWGAVLSIHDRADRITAEAQSVLDVSEGVEDSKIVVTELDLGHGLLYRPHNEWVDEVVKWSGIAH